MKPLVTDNFAYIYANFFLCKFSSKEEQSTAKVAIETILGRVLTGKSKLLPVPRVRAGVKSRTAIVFL